MKDSLEKQDKTKTVDIFQVLADSIQKEFVQSIFYQNNLQNSFQILKLLLAFISPFLQV